MLSIKTFSLLVVSAAIGAMAESHTVRFLNRCGRGTPTLVRAGQILSTGQDFTSNGPLLSAIAYLQTGSCLLNGEHCTLIETTLINPIPGQGGSGSSTDISLISPHEFSVTTGFNYFNGCDGQGHTCNNANCPDAFRQPGDTHVQVQCQVNDVDLQITFC